MDQHQDQSSAAGPNSAPDFSQSPNPAPPVPQAPNAFEQQPVPGQVPGPAPLPTAVAGAPNSAPSQLPSPIQDQSRTGRSAHPVIGHVGDCLIVLAMIAYVCDILYNLSIQTAAPKGIVVASGVAVIMLAAGYLLGYGMRPPRSKPYRFWPTFLKRFGIFYAVTIVAGLLGILVGNAQRGGKELTASLSSVLVDLFVANGLPLLIFMLIYHGAYRRVAKPASWLHGASRFVRNFLQAVTGAALIIIAAFVFLLLDVVFSEPDE